MRVFRPVHLVASPEISYAAATSKGRGGEVAAAPVLARAGVTAVHSYKQFRGEMFPRQEVSARPGAGRAGAPLPQPCHPEAGSASWPESAAANLPGLMFDRARRWPDRPMLRAWRGGGWQGMTWTVFARRAASVARALRAAGVRPATGW